MKYKIGDLVKFNIVTDDSGWATDKFGVEPQLNGWHIEVYTEEKFGEIVKRNTIEVINKNGQRSGRFYKIQDGKVMSEILNLIDIKAVNSMKLSEIFDGSTLRTMKDFERITVVPYIELESKWEFHSCLTEFPPVGFKTSIWEKQEIGRMLRFSACFDGVWKNGKSNKIFS